MGKLVDSLRNRRKEAEGKATELEDRPLGLLVSDRKNKRESVKKNTQELWDTLNKTSIQTIGTAEGEGLWVGGTKSSSVK